MNKTILIVDDAVFMRMKLKKIIEASGYQIIEAKDGLQAFELFKEQKPDLVIMDISMPEMDGLTSLRYMMEHDNSIPVIMCSAIGQESKILEAGRLGAKDFIVKPFKDKEIEEVLNCFLEENGR